MNTRQLRKSIGKKFILRPIPLRVDDADLHLPQHDDEWRLDDVLEAPAGIRVTNTATGQSIALESDNVQERRSPNFLILRCQLTLRPNGVDLEPIRKHETIQPKAISLSSVVTQLEHAPLIARSDLERKFVGTLVRCRGKLGSVSESTNGMLRVSVMEDDGEDVFCHVPASTYPRLRIARNGERVELVGVLRHHGIMIELEDAELAFVDGTTAPFEDRVARRPSVRNAQEQLIYRIASVCAALYIIPFVLLRLSRDSTHIGNVSLGLFVLAVSLSLFLQAYSWRNRSRISLIAHLVAVAPSVLMAVGVTMFLMSIPES